MARKRRLPILEFALLVCGLVVLSLAFIGGDGLGRRLICQIRYYVDVRFWSNWVAFAFWLVAGAIACYYFVTRASNQEKIQARLERSAVPALSRLPRARYGQVALLFFALIAALVVAGALIDFKSIWRFLRYRLYGEFFQAPISALVSRGEFDPKLLLGPALILGAIIVAYVVKKRRGKLVALIIATCGVALVDQSARAELAPRIPLGDKRIQIIVPAEYDAALNPEAVSETPSVKNQDGGYDANDAIVKCFAQAAFIPKSISKLNPPIPFRLRTPLKVVSGKKYPLIIWFHGYGESVGDNRRHLAHLHRAIQAFVGPDALDFYMIALQLPNLETVWTSPTNRDEHHPEETYVDLVSEIFHAALEELPIDPDRVEVIGISSGACAAWLFTASHADELASLVAFSATVDDALRPKDFTKLSIWTFNNEGDVGAQPDKPLAFAEKVNKLGGNMYVTAKPYGQHDTWSGSLGKKEVIAWSVSQSRTGVGRLQDVPYPRRSWLEIGVKFILPLLLVAYFARRIARARRDKQGVESATSEIESATELADAQG